MKCKNCGTEMGHYLGSEAGKKVYEFWRCSKCWSESKHFWFHFEDEENKRNEKRSVSENPCKRRKSAGLRRNHR